MYTDCIMASKSFKRAPSYSSFALISLILASLSWILGLLYFVDDVAPIIFSFCPCSETNAVLWALTWLHASSVFLSLASCLFVYPIFDSGQFCSINRGKRKQPYISNLSCFIRTVLTKLLAFYFYFDVLFCFSNR